jgi:hypothetical protein
MVIHYSNPERSDGEQSLILIRVERGKVSARSQNVAGLEGRAIFMLSVSSWELDP